MADLADVSTKEMQGEIEQRMVKPYLADISTEEMKTEIKRREREAKESVKPKPLAEPDFGPVVKICQDYIDDLAKTGHADENYERWIFETAMTAVFGREVWEWTGPILRGDV